MMNLESPSTDSADNVQLNEEEFENLLEEHASQIIDQFGELTMADWKLIIEELQKDFPPEAIEVGYKADTRKGYDTIGYNAQYLIDRLNEVVGGKWIPDYKILRETESILTMRNGEEKIYFEITMEIGVTVYGIRRMGFGGGKSPVLADAYKMAFTSGLKKAFSLFSLGSKAYTGQLKPPNDVGNKGGFKPNVNFKTPVMPPPTMNFKAPMAPPMMPPPIQST